MNTKLKDVYETWQLYKWHKSGRLWEESHSNFVWRLIKEDKRVETKNGKEIVWVIFFCSFLKEINQRDYGEHFAYLRCKEQRKRIEILWITVLKDIHLEIQKKKKNGYCIEIMSYINRFKNGNWILLTLY